MEKTRVHTNMSYLFAPLCVFCSGGSALEAARVSPAETAFHLIALAQACAATSAMARSMASVDLALLYSAGVLLDCMKGLQAVSVDESQVA